MGRRDTAPFAPSSSVRNDAVSERAAGPSVSADREGGRYLASRSSSRAASRVAASPFDAAADGATSGDDVAVDTERADAGAPPPRSSRRKPAYEDPWFVAEVRRRLPDATEFNALLTDPARRERTLAAAEAFLKDFQETKSALDLVEAGIANRLVSAQDGALALKSEAEVARELRRRPGARTAFTSAGTFVVDVEVDANAAESAQRESIREAMATRMWEFRFRELPAIRDT